MLRIATIAHDVSTLQSGAVPWPGVSRGSWVAATCQRAEHRRRMQCLRQPLDPSAGELGSQAFAISEGGVIASGRVSGVPARAPR